MSNTSYVDSGYWVPGFSEGDDGIAPFSPWDTVISQYANSPTILQLINNFNQQISMDATFQTFLDFIWNLDTAQGFGLDILGRIINLPRRINVPAIYPFTVTPGLQDMTDGQYRYALYLKASANVSDSSFPGINAGLKIFARGRGNAFTVPDGVMKIQYRFYYAPEPYEYALIDSGDVAMRGAGVGFDNMFTINPYFGFAEGESWSPWGQAPFAAY